MNTDTTHSFRRFAWKISVLLFGLFTALQPLSNAQSSVSGVITDAATGEPIIGANIMVEGTNKGAATNIDGEYVIEGLSAGNYTLRVRYIGFKEQTQEIALDENEDLSLDFQLEQGSINLDEVVVTGTGGPVEVRKLGNTIGRVDASELENTPIQSFSDVLQGRVAGLTGLPSSGVTGEGSRIRIRGSSSLSQSNEPIVLVDGIRVDNGGGFGGSVSAGGSASPSRLDDINPSSIDRVEVLKGAAAATLYGTEASNGVIQIFTKNGRANAPQFDFKVTQGAINYPKTIPDNVGFARTQAQADTMSFYYDQDIDPWELVSRNYVHQLYETGITQEYSGSISGGTEGITYYVNTRWMDENGPHSGENIPFPNGTKSLADDQLNRFQTNANISIFPVDNLQIRFKSAYTQTNLETFQTGNNVQGVTSGAMHGKPELVSYDNRSGTSYSATLQERLQQTVEQEVQAFNTSLGLNYRPLETLTLDGTFGISYTSQFSEEVRPFGWNINNYASIETEGSRITSDRSNLNITADVKAIANHQLNERFESTFIGGFQVFQQQNLVRSATGISFPGPGLNVTGAAAEQSVNETYIEETQTGIFLQEQIGFDDHIFVTAGARLDAHSAFGSDFDAVIYPKLSGSYVFSDAPYWEENETISSLRLRAAVGQSGLQPGAFDALTTYASLTSGNGAGIVPQNLGNPDLKPEISTEYELGVDAGFFQERVTLDATYWDRTVRDALVQRNFPASGGFLQPQLDNIGELKGRGVEIGLEFRIVENKTWSADVFTNTAYLWEQVTSLGGAAPIKVGGSYPRYRQYLIEGYAPGSNFGAKLQDVQDGYLPLDQRGLLEALGRDVSGLNYGEAASRELVLDYLSSLTPGTADLETLNSYILLADEDGDDNPLDHYLGKPTPDWTGSFGGSLRYKNFTVSTLFEYSAGNFYVNNLTEGFRNRSAGIGRNTPDAARVDRNYTTGGIDSDNQPQNNGEVRLDAAEEWLDELVALDPFPGLNAIQPADFIRLRELSLTYNLAPQLLDRFNIRRLSFTLSGRNLALWTKYSGPDPEVNAIGRSGGTDLENNYLLGTDAWNMPLPRRILFTVNLGI
ncbi:SusC/RagA family TonB-linked outer membrane protein [Gracilimonas mengyeensis]|uniref:TonB-linked outer membrane protein, SusC/RagA family n=1 Tax=Gracilimonas mengyeensis TaxID=1302730 RepID=A0A521EA47_9BACT|nr:SusC/RagA family TonB-linked outer membrane protein [Gracilimonas mengyeensis]SMO80807.1 TonB-linked outer membrane protein, SusC/RagA family [Gracilimonas mengyeensis]